MGKKVKNSVNIQHLYLDCAPTWDLCWSLLSIKSNTWEAHAREAVSNCPSKRCFKDLPRLPWHLPRTRQAKGILEIWPPVESPKGGRCPAHKHFFFSVRIKFTDTCRYLFLSHPSFLPSWIFLQLPSSEKLSCSSCLAALNATAAFMADTSIETQMVISTIFNFRS